MRLKFQNVVWPVLGLCIVSSVRAAPATRFDVNALSHVQSDNEPSPMANPVSRSIESIPQNPASQMIPRNSMRVQNTKEVATSIEVKILDAPPQSNNRSLRSRTKSLIRTWNDRRSAPDRPEFLEWKFTVAEQTSPSSHSTLVSNKIHFEFKALSINGFGEVDMQSRVEEGIVKSSTGQEYASEMYSGDNNKIRGNFENMFEEWKKKRKVP